MRLVFIYGPPASGKLTVAKELAKMTGFRLFHNHVSIQFVQSIFEFGTKAFWRLTEKYRLEMLEEASKERVDTIFTFVYAKGSDDAFVRKIARQVKLHSGQVYFVRLYCSRRELFRRVDSLTRKSQGKLATVGTLRTLLRKSDLDSDAPIRPNLTIDTTNMSPKKVARMIVQHYNLRTE
jgi:shikimate kinase